MRAVVYAALVAMVGMCTTSLAASPDGNGTEMPDSAGVRLPYRLERGDLYYEDILTTADGTKLTGKVLEWGGRVLLFDARGSARVFSLLEVDRFEFRRRERHRAKPGLPDLTVAYVERLPRDPSWHGHVSTEDGVVRLDVDPEQTPWHPAIGSKVTFRAHVLNAGDSPSPAVICRIGVDGADAARETLPKLAPGAEAVVEASWPWQSGDHTLRIEIDPDGHAREIVRWNNLFTEPINALAVTVVVARDRYEAFRAVPSLVDSFCLEDYIQYHMRNMNALFASSIYPSAPEGVKERVRCDRIVVVDDPSDPAERKHWERTLRRGGEADGLAEYAALLVLGKEWLKGDLSLEALKVDWSMLQRIGREIGLVDLDATDTTVDACFVPDKFNRYALRRYLSPLRQSLMYTAGGFPLTEEAACFLNKTRGRPRGIRGDYLFQVPEKLVVEVLSNAGRPLSGVRVDMYQLKSEGEDKGRIIGIGRRDPLVSASTDQHGRAVLPNLPAPEVKTPGGYALRPNPFGRIATDGSNGLLLLRLRAGEEEEFHFLPLVACNVAYCRGQRQEYVHPLRTHFAESGAPARPPDSTTLMEDRSEAQPPLTVLWWVPKGTDPKAIEEFRVYKRTGFGGDGLRGWTLASTVGPKAGRWIPRSPETYFDELTYQGPYALDTFFAVSMVDRSGRESGLSEPAYLPYGVSCLKLAIEGDAAYMTLRGAGAVKMLYWDGVAGTQPFAMKTGRVEGYSPTFSGIAFTPSGRMVVTDPVNHVLAWYDKSRYELERVLPARGAWPGVPDVRPGAFSAPADVAVDESGNLYVADSGNDRVQILDSNGRFKAMLDEDFRFREPHAVCCSNGHLCVTDHGGRRCRVYALTSDGPKFLRELPPLFDADRAVVNKAGQIFITGRESEDGIWAVLVFAPLGETARLVETRTEGRMGKYHRPRGLYLYPGLDHNFAYFANDFPFDVRRVHLEKKPRQTAKAGR